jgi:hypothetical protein
MKQQDYNHHIFYYPPHHFVLYGAIILAFVLCGLGYCSSPTQHGLWAMMAIVVFLLVYLAFMTRQHYALGGQNRTVRLEMRLRYYILTGSRLEQKEAQLSFRQLAALRFASDTELPVLIDAAISEQLSTDQIKQRIKEWLPDTMRV